MAAAPWQAVAALVDQVRRALYDYVRRQDHLAALRLAEQRGVTIGRRVGERGRAK